MGVFPTTKTEMPVITGSRGMYPNENSPVERGPGYKTYVGMNDGPIKMADPTAEAIFTVMTLGGSTALRAVSAEGAAGAASTAAKVEMTTVGRWMSKSEYSTMANTGRMVEGAGGQTFVGVGGSGAFNGAAKGSVYAEFQIPTNSLLQGGQSNWFKVIGPNAKASQQYILQKQGGQMLPEIQNLSPILEVK